MLEVLYLYFQYRKYNTKIARKLKIQRDKKYEHYILSKLKNTNAELEEDLKKNCRCFIKYYEEREKELDFKALNYIICRIMATFLITQDEEVLELEQQNFTNPFCELYVRNKIAWLKGDTFIENHLNSNIEAVI